MDNQFDNLTWADLVIINNELKTVCDNRGCQSSIIR